MPDNRDLQRDLNYLGIATGTVGQCLWCRMPFRRRDGGRGRAQRYCCPRHKWSASHYRKKLRAHGLEPEKRVAA